MDVVLYTVETRQYEVLSYDHHLYTSALSYYECIKNVMLLPKILPKVCVNKESLYMLRPYQHQITVFVVVLIDECTSDNLLYLIPTGLPFIDEFADIPSEYKLLLKGSTLYVFKDNTATDIRIYRAMNE